MNDGNPVLASLLLSPSYGIEDRFHHAQLPAPRPKVLPLEGRRGASIQARQVRNTVSAPSTGGLGSTRGSQASRRMSGVGDDELLLAPQPKRQVGMLQRSSSVVQDSGHSMSIS